MILKVITFQFFQFFQFFQCNCIGYSVKIIVTNCHAKRKKEIINFFIA